MFRKVMKHHLLMARIKLKCYFLVLWDKIGCTKVWERSLPAHHMMWIKVLHKFRNCEVHQECRKPHFCRSRQGADDITEVHTGHNYFRHLLYITHQSCTALIFQHKLLPLSSTLPDSLCSFLHHWTVPLCQISSPNAHFTSLVEL